MIHRDVKPANLLVDERNNIWITDFGLAMFNNDLQLTRTGDMVGTLRYMSPEQASGDRVVMDHRADIYGLGATLYELLTLEYVVTPRTRRELCGKFCKKNLGAAGHRQANSAGTRNDCFESDCEGSQRSLRHGSSNGGRPGVLAG